MDPKKSICLVATAKSRFNPIQFFFSEYMKSLVYETPMGIQKALLGRHGTCHVQQVPHIFQRVRDSMSQRINLYKKVGGRHFKA